MQYLRTSVSFITPAHTHETHLTQTIPTYVAHSAAHTRLTHVNKSDMAVLMHEDLLECTLSHILHP